jgi:lipid-binding SYLF domain-containing protein
MYLRSAPLPLKVDGFSMGAVVGYSTQHTLLLLTSEDEVQPFLHVSRRSSHTCRCHISAVLCNSCAMPLQNLSMEHLL